jgi:hypothetical protein
MDNIKKDGGVFIFENCKIAIYEITDKTRDELNVELSDDEEMEEEFYNPFEEAVNHAIDVLKGVSNDTSLHD